MHIFENSKLYNFKKEKLEKIKDNIEENIFKQLVSEKAFEKLAVDLSKFLGTKIVWEKIDYSDRNGGTIKIRSNNIIKEVGVFRKSLEWFVLEDFGIYYTKENLIAVKIDFRWKYNDKGGMGENGCGLCGAFYDFKKKFWTIK